MSEWTLHFKLHENEPDGYLYICTGAKVGCMPRHGPADVGPRTLEFKLCPICDKKTTENKLRLLKQRGY